jgi:hypothetical protein
VVFRSKGFASERLCSLSGFVGAPGPTPPGRYQQLESILQAVWFNIPEAEAQRRHGVRTPGMDRQTRVRAERALEMPTIEPAFAVSMENYIGSILLGKYADLIILSNDPLTIDPNRLIVVNVLMPTGNGKIQYCASENGRYCPWPHEIMMMFGHSKIAYFIYSRFHGIKRVKSLKKSGQVVE